MPRLLYIVSRRNPQLYADLERTLVDDRDVVVIRDRRRRERRQRAIPHRPERRVSEQRSLNINEGLRRAGWAVTEARG